MQLVSALLLGVSFGVCRAPCGVLADTAAPCSGPEYHSFDFWLGDWDVFEVESGNKVAHARIDSVLNNCALREDYQGMSGGKGLSLSSWDDQRREWRQYWVSDRGAIVAIEGGLENGAMILTGTEQGTHSLDQVRGIWKQEGNDVRETGLRSQDDGRTWKPWFDLRFRRAKDHAPSTTSDMRVCRYCAAEIPNGVLSKE